MSGTTSNPVVQHTRSTRFVTLVTLNSLGEEQDAGLCAAALNEPHAGLLGESLDSAANVTLVLRRQGGMEIVKDGLAGPLSRVRSHSNCCVAGVDEHSQQGTRQHDLHSSRQFFRISILGLRSGDFFGIYSLIAFLPKLNRSDHIGRDQNT